MQNRWILAGALVAAVATTGCATRGSVRDLSAQVQQQSEQQAQQLDATGRRIDAVDARASQLGDRVGALDGRVNGLDGRVNDLARHYHGAKVVQTIEVPFRFNRAALDDRAMTRLHELAKTLQADGRLAAELIGYTDARGPQAYNVELAQRRVEAVRRYLAQQGAPVSRLAAIGLGPSPERNVPDAKKRRVIVRIMMGEPMVVDEAAVAQAKTR
jgi:outer membrane protein OmpA-like peptidoglycan-associated protein